MASTKLSRETVEEAFRLFLLVTAQLEDVNICKRMKPWQLLMLYHMDDYLQDWFKSEQNRLRPMLTEDELQILTRKHIMRLVVDEKAARLEEEKQRHERKNRHQQEEVWKHIHATWRLQDALGEKLEHQDEKFENTDGISLAHGNTEDSSVCSKSSDIAASLASPPVAVVPNPNDKGRDVSSTQVSATPGIGHRFGVSTQMITFPLSYPVNEPVSRVHRRKQANPRRREPTREMKRAKRLTTPTPHTKKSVTTPQPISLVCSVKSCSAAPVLPLKRSAQRTLEDFNFSLKTISVRNNSTTSLRRRKQLHPKKREPKPPKQQNRHSRTHQAVFGKFDKQ